MEARGMELRADAAVPPRKVAASVQVCCPRCDAVFFHGFGAAQDGTDGGGCPGCSLERSSEVSAPEPDRPISCCWFCGNDEFYLQKDFNRQLGLNIVFTSALVVFLVMLWTTHVVGLIVLAAIALVDWGVYQLLRTVSVCYLCQSIYRGFPLDSEHKGFYLGTEEKFKHRRQEWLKTIQ